MSPRTGRPKSDNPRRHDIKVRLTEAEHNKLLECCESKGISKAECIRQAINYFLDNEQRK